MSLPAAGRAPLAMSDQRDLMNETGVHHLLLDGRSRRRSGRERMTACLEGCAGDRKDYGQAEFLEGHFHDECSGIAASAEKLDALPAFGRPDGLPECVVTTNLS